MCDAHLPDGPEFAWWKKHPPKYPFGECQCGCGIHTRIAPYTYRRLGWICDLPKRFRSGHNAKPSPAAIHDSLALYIAGMSFDNIMQTTGVGYKALRGQCIARGVVIHTPSARGAPPGATLTFSGREYVVAPWHTNATLSGRYVRKSRYVGSAMLGRPLATDEHALECKSTVIVRRVGSKRLRPCTICKQPVQVTEFVFRDRAECNIYCDNCISQGRWHVGSKLSPGDVCAIRARRSQGESETRLAGEYGVSSTTINKITRGKSFCHLPILGVPENPKARDTKGIKNGQAKLSDDCIRSIRKRYVYGSSSMLADEFGVSRATITRIVQRKIWKHVTNGESQ